MDLRTAGTRAPGIALSILLPRDALSVPTVRHVTEYVLQQVGTLRVIIDDIAIALSEACTNVLRHADEGRAYEVEVVIDSSTCEIRVTDDGPGFDPDALPAQAPPTAETGRGVTLMRALVDEVRFTTLVDGSSVQLVKHLEFEEGSPHAQLLQIPPAPAQAVNGPAGSSGDPAR